MKKLVSLVCVLTLVLSMVSTLPAFTEERIPKYTRTVNAASLDLWGGYANNPDDERPSHEKVDVGLGTPTGVSITGGGGEGGFIFCHGGGFASGTHGASKEYTGLVDATEIVIKYKSDQSFRIGFEADYRVSPKVVLKSRELSMPNTNGEWSEITLPLSAFEPAANGKWVYNMNGVYQTTNFNPAILIKLHAVKPGKNIVISTFSANWYQEDMVSSASISGQKTSYYQNYDSFDYSQGKISIKRGDSGEVFEELALDDPRVAITGFKNTDLNNNMKLTVTVLNKKIEFYVQVVPYVLPPLAEITLNPPKTEYWELEDFDFTKGSITVTVPGEDTETVALNHPNVKITGFNSAVPVDSQTITVTYGGRTLTYQVKIKDFAFTGGIRIDGAKKLYKKGDLFDWHAGTIVLENGPSGKLFSIYSKVSGFDSSNAVKDQVITVTYGELTTTYNIDIIDEDIPVKYYIEQTMHPGSQPACWQWGDHFTLGVVDGKAENGIGPAIWAEGDGTHGGGGAIVFLDAKCGAGSVTMPDGTVLDGLKGMDAVKFRYKNHFTIQASNYAQYAPTLQMKLEYQGGSGTSVSSGSYKLPVTGDVWTDYVMPISVFDSTDKTKETASKIDWLYNDLKTKYLGQYSPSLQMRFNAKVAGGDIFAIENMKMIWYEDQQVDSITVEGAKTEYKVKEKFNTSSGQVTIKYRDGKTRVTGLEYMNVSGFDTGSAAESQTVTLSYAGAKATYQINVIAADIVYEESHFEDDAGVTEAFDGLSAVKAVVTVRNDAQVPVLPQGVLLAAAYAGDKLSLVKPVVKYAVSPGTTNLYAEFSSEELEGITMLKIIAFEDEVNCAPIFDEVKFIKKD